MPAGLTVACQLCSRRAPACRCRADCGSDRSSRTRRKVAVVLEELGERYGVRQGSRKYVGSPIPWLYPAQIRSLRNCGKGHKAGTGSRRARNARPFAPNGRNGGLDHRMSEEPRQTVRSSAAMNRTFRFRGAPVFILEGAAAFATGGAVSDAREAALIPRKLSPRRSGVLHLAIYSISVNVMLSSGKFPTHREFA